MSCGHLPGRIAPYILFRIAPPFVKQRSNKDPQAEKKHRRQQEEHREQEEQKERSQNSKHVLGESKKNSDKNKTKGEKP